MQALASVSGQAQVIAVSTVVNSLFGSVGDDLVETAKPFSERPYNIKLQVGDDREGKYTLSFNVLVFEVTRKPV